jgi:hypothetical protein
MRWFITLLTLAGITSLHRVADAQESVPSRAECAGAYESAQEQRLAGKLLSARQLLQLCANEACPDFVRNDCVAWHDEVQSEIPTLVFAAKSQGRDLSAVRVWAGERLLSARIDGQAIELDPGVYELRFEADAMQPLDRHVVVARGERDGLVAVALEPLVSRSVERRSNARTESSLLLPASLLGLGALGIGSSAVLAIKGRAMENDLADRCSPRCDAGRVDEVRNHYFLGDVALGVGVTSLVLGTYLLATRTQASHRASQTPHRVAVIALPRAAAVSYGGAF